jgi:hypothetical protein
MFFLLFEMNETHVIPQLAAVAFVCFTKKVKPEKKKLRS